MKDFESILTAARAARASGHNLALATVVDVEGSAYRLPGARMLIADGKWVAGSISGGCLEDDVVLRAAEAVATRKTVVTTYDTTSDDDIVFGVGLGCKGVITILIEPLESDDTAARAERQAPDILAVAQSCLRERTGALVATVVRSAGESGVQPGARLVAVDGRTLSGTGVSELDRAIETRLSAVQTSGLIAVACSGGSADVFVERFVPPPKLVVFGAGHDAMPVVELAKTLGWHVTLVDHRSAYASDRRFPRADRIEVGQADDVVPRLELERDTLALVMTHNYLRDQALVSMLLPLDLRYVGLLGPKRRTEQILAELVEQGTAVTAEQRERLYGPVGLDIGSESPVEVALSILAEMQAVLQSHAGGHLRDRKRPIHAT